MWFGSIYEPPKGSHEQIIEDIKRCNDANDLIRGCDANVDTMILMQAAAEADNALISDASEKEQSGERERLSELISVRLARMKELVYNDISNNSASEGSFAIQISRALTQDYPLLFSKLLRLMPTVFVPFEARKNIAAVFNFLLTGTTTSAMFGEYALAHYHELMTPIFAGFDSQLSPDTSLLCGTMFRATLKHTVLHRKLLDSDQLNSAAAKTEQSVMSTTDSSSQQHQQEQQEAAQYNQRISCHETYLYPLLEKYVFVPNFDVASDALTTVREIFTGDTSIASEYLDRDYDAVFAKYNLMLQSDSYVTKRMSLKLLGEILLNRSNFNVMMKYISSRDNLKIIMCLLCDPSGNIQFEAFHVFKIFVANPNKPPQITKVLAQNKVKLVAYLDQFHKDKESSDEQFRDEKNLLISTLSGTEDA